MKSKLLSAALALVMLASALTACSEGGGSDTDKTPSSAPVSEAADSSSIADSSESDSSETETTTTTTTTTTAESSSETTSETTTTAKQTTTESTTAPQTTETQTEKSSVITQPTTKYIPPQTSASTTRASSKTSKTTTKSNANYVGKCNFCRKNVTASDSVDIGEYRVCNSCKSSKCLLCGKACNSSIGKQQTDSYIGSHWFCYSCRPDLKPNNQTAITGTDTDARREAQSVVTLTNKLRASKGLSQLKTDSRLTEAAMARAKELAARFSHSRPSGKAGSTIVYEYIPAPNTSGENIHKSYGTGYHDGEYIYSSLENSPGHKATMLVQNTQYIGVGIYYVYKDGYKYTYAVQLFCISV